MAGDERRGEERGEKWGHSLQWQERREEDEEKRGHSLQWQEMRGEERR